ncbi:protein MKS1-like [Aristolochia californica]|uniref:protein MKS1-like n=1 Tax=Aristolochia californica TaxID=171875 RepID=UPI0035DF53EF
MDPPEAPAGTPPPRREMQGPRPTPLKVSKDSYKIKKPPLAPSHQQSQPPLHPRQPVIIYTVSPKVIHTNASDFMTLVQRLTGFSSAAESSSSSAVGSSSQSGELSPAARLAAIQKTQVAEVDKMATEDMDIVNQLDMPASFDRAGNFPGILSPLPSSLPLISPNFFSPSADPNSLSFLHDLSPFFMSKNFIEGTFVPSPTAASFLSPTISYPSPSFDLFNQFHY